MDHLRSLKIMESNLRSSDFNIDLYIEELQAVLASVFDLLGEEYYCELQEDAFPFRSAENVLKLISSYQDALADARENGSKYFWTNNIAKSLSHCESCREDAIQAFKEIEEAIANSQDSRQTALLKKLHSSLRASCNELIRAVVSLCERMKYDYSSFSLDEL